MVLRYFSVGNHDLWWYTLSIDSCWTFIWLSKKWKSNEPTSALSSWNVKFCFCINWDFYGSLFSFQLIELCWTFKESLRPTFIQICESLRCYLYGSSPIDYSDLDYVDYPPLSTSSISDFASTTVLPMSTSGIATDTNSHSQTTTAATSSSSLS